MDDPSWAWPAWKFDMKTGDLFTKLHDQYNTYPSPLQDPDAFYHDISEISHEANSVAEFHHLANNRRQQRLSELNDAFESASLEIIANPSLVSTPQWQHAVQLFRTNSLDSLVRYFASYLPTDHVWHPSSHESATATSSTELMPHLPDEECEHTRTFKPHFTTNPSGSKRLTLPPDSSGTPVRDRPVGRSEPMNTETHAVVFSFLEPGLKRFQPQEFSSHIHRCEEMTRSGDDTSTMPVSDNIKTAECANRIAYNGGVRPDQGLSANLLGEQVELRSHHSDSWLGPHVHCRGTARPQALPYPATATLASGRSRTTSITSTSSIRPTNRARAGTKRKRP